MPFRNQAAHALANRKKADNPLLRCAIEAWRIYRVTTGIRRSVLLGALISSPALQAQSPLASAPPFEGFTAGGCAIAPRWIDQLATRDIDDQTVYVPAKDTTSRLATDSVRVCAKGFVGSTSDEWQLLNLGRVQLILGADADARSLAQRYLRAVGTSAAEKRAWALYLIASDNAEAQPARFDAAREALTELDALGTPAAKARVLAHFAVAGAAQRHFDDKQVSSEANAAIAAWKLLEPRAGLQAAMALALSYIMKAEIVLREIGPAPARAIIDTADKVVPQNARGPRALINLYKGLYAVLGTQAAPIDAAFWYATDSDVGATPKPVRGRVRIISNALHSCRALCRAQYDGLRRYGERFAGRADIINITQTLGFYADSTPVTPPEEARYDSAYFLGKQRLPGALAVAETVFDWIPDGRRRNRPTAQDTNYPNARIVVVDKKGVIRYATVTWNALLEEPLARFIETLIAEP